MSNDDLIQAQEEAAEDARQRAAYQGLVQGGWPKGLCKELYEQGIDLIEIRGLVDSRKVSLADIARQIGYTGDLGRYAEQPTNQGNSSQQGQRSQQSAQRATQAARPREQGRGARFYRWLREVLAYTLATALFSALLYISITYTQRGIESRAAWLGWAWLIGFVNDPIWRWVIPLAITALGREFFPFVFGYEGWRVSWKPGRGPAEFFLFLLVSGFGVWMTVEGAQADFAQTTFVGTSFLALVVAAILLEITPEPFLEYFGGRLIQRIPVLSHLLRLYVHLNGKLRNWLETRRRAADRARAQRQQAARARTG